RDGRLDVEVVVQAAALRIERARIADAREKTGVATGAFARNPWNDAQIPIWIADYVLAGYGTGAIMAVPGHDERDHEFATRFGLPIVEVVRGGADIQKEAYSGDGVAVNSGPLDGLSTPEAKKKIIGSPQAQKVPQR